MLSPRAAMQLLWNRTVNVHGRPGRNISCDLHMEHLNRAAKNDIVGIGSNITDQAVKRVGKSVGYTVSILQKFDSTNEIKQPSGRHSKRSIAKDMKIILDSKFLMMTQSLSQSFLKIWSKSIALYVNPWYYSVDGRETSKTYNTSMPWLTTKTSLLWLLQELQRWQVHTTSHTSQHSQ